MNSSDQVASGSSPWTYKSKFLKVLTFSEFEQIIYLLNDITKQSFDMAVECLDNSYNFLNRVADRLGWLRQDHTLDK